jgi:hypothetical protein
MKEHRKKMFAPAIIVAAIIVYYVFAIIAMMKFDFSITIKIAGIVFSIIISFVFIAMLIERIKEIKQGEEDDLGNY